MEDVSAANKASRARSEARDGANSTGSASDGSQEPSEGCCYSMNGPGMVEHDDIPAHSAKLEEEFFFVIKMDSFDVGAGTEVEERFRQLVCLIESELGSSAAIEGENIDDEDDDESATARKPFIVLNRGAVDAKHSFIVVSCCREALEKQAEESKLHLPVRASYGGGFAAFTRETACRHKFETVGFTAQQKMAGEIFTPAQKQKLVHTRLQHVFDAFMDLKGGVGLDTAKREGLVKDFFPLHTLRRSNASYMSRRKFLLQHMNWASMFITPFNWSRRHLSALSYLRDYFGEKIALYFNFLHSYVTWLIALSIVGVAVAVVLWSTTPENMWPLMFYSVVVSVWSCMFVESVCRSSIRHACAWGMGDYEFNETELETFVQHSDGKSYGYYESGGSWVSLSEYVGTLSDPNMVALVPRRARYNAGKLPEWMGKRGCRTMVWRFCKKVLSNSILTLLVALVVIATLALLWFRTIVQRVNATWGGVAGGTANAVAIFILDAVYRIVATKLNDWEYYRTATEYNDALILKIFTFSFVNGYFSLFYIAFWKGRYSLFGAADQCLDFSGNETDSCIEELSTQLSSLLIVRVFLGNAIELGLPYLKSKLKVLRAKRHSEMEFEDRMTSPDASSATEPERQATLAKYGDGVVCGTFYDYMELCLQLGYVTLFAPAFPLGALVALLSNGIEGVVDGWKILIECQRPFYQGAQDLGSWALVLRFLSVSAVLCNTAILLFTFDTDDYERSSIYIIIAIEHGVLLLQFLVATLFNDIPAGTRVMLERQKAIKCIEGEYLEQQRGDGPAASRKLRRRHSPYKMHFQDSEKLQGILPAE